MRILSSVQGTEDWLADRRGKVTGTRLKDIVVLRGTGRKLGFYELIAERLAPGSSDVDGIDRGLRLEEDGVAAFEQHSGKAVERVGLCVKDGNESIANSPDGLIKNAEGKYAEALEVKCLSTARHLQAYFEKEVPSDYRFQVLQYFIVNDDLETLHVAFYDPRLPQLPLHVIEVRREDVAEDVATYLAYQEQTLREVEEHINQLSF